MAIEKIYIKDKDELASVCMPFIKGGGLFIKTSAQYALGDTINIELKLLDEADEYAFIGKVVWITPKHEQNQLPEGVGVQFVGEDAVEVHNKIEAIMPDAFAVNRQTDTM